MRTYFHKHVCLYCLKSKECKENLAYISLQTKFWQSVVLFHKRTQQSKTSVAMWSLWPSAASEKMLVIFLGKSEGHKVIIISQTIDEQVHSQEGFQTAKDKKWCDNIYYKLCFYLSSQWGITVRFKSLLHLHMFIAFWGLVLSLSPTHTQCVWRACDQTTNLPLLWTDLGRPCEWCPV